MGRAGFELTKGVYVPGTKWMLVREIARGGMGVTWEVVKKPNIRGVMKMILPDLAKSGSYVKRFFEEVDILTQLNHPNIVQVFDFDTLEDGTPFFVMERLTGKTLGAALVRTDRGARVRKALPARVAYEITRQTCEALYRAHSFQPKGVIHRDIKPENIYLHHPEFGEPIIKLLDFGVAAYEQGARDTGPVGTPRYMAPEQLRCLDLTPKADLYAMGLVLYEMLVGRGPFDDLASAAHPNERTLVLVNAHLERAPPPPSRFAPWIPKTVDSLILSALDKDPERRPLNAYAFATKLFELQFVNDGTPREEVDANTTAPTLVRLIEDEATEEGHASKPSERAAAGRALPNDTVREAAPAGARALTVRMQVEPVDPLGQTAPTPPRGASAKRGVDRDAPTRLSANEAPRRRAPQTNTEPMVSGRRVEPHGGEAAATSPEPATPEATPITSEMPARPNRKASRRASEERVATRVWRRFSLLQWVALLVVMPALGVTGAVGLRRWSARPAAPIAAEARAQASRGVAAPNETAPVSSVAALPASALPAPALPSSAVDAVAIQMPAVVGGAPSTSASTGPALVRAKPLIPKAATAKPPGSKPSSTSTADDGRDLLYVPPK